MDEIQQFNTYLTVTDGDENLRMETRLDQNLFKSRIRIMLPCQSIWGGGEALRSPPNVIPQYVIPYHCNKINHR